MRRIAPIALVLIALTACSTGSPDAPAETATVGDVPPGTRATGSEGGDGDVRRVDPRQGGLDVALGEWALTLEAAIIRPGRVTFTIVNRGTMDHGFEIELEGEDDSSGPGSGEDGLKAETSLIAPGERTRLTMDLPAGVYKVECLVDGHDDMGMEGFLEVRRDAPLVRAEADAAEGSDVTIRDFAFAPAELEVAAGAEVTWTNDDPTPHTVTAGDGSFDSGEIAPGDSFTLRVEGAGTVTYACSFHPEMSGTLRIG